MKIKSNNKHFTLFGLAGEPGHCVAVANEYLPFIEQAEKEYGSLANVPADKTVRGIFVIASETFDETAQQNDITINNLVKN